MTMIPQTDVADLMEHIRDSATTTTLIQRGTNGAPLPNARDSWPQMDAGDFPPPPPAPAFGAFPESDPVPLAEAASLLPRAEEKLTVRPGIPGVLRPMFRNQGGFNGILLQTCGRLVEVSQQLQEENVRLRARFDALADHLAEQNLWLAALARENTESRRWMRAAQGHVEHRFEEFDARCFQAEIRLDRAEGLLGGVKAAADEQGGDLARLDTQFEQQQAWIQDMQAHADEATALSAEQVAPDDATRNEARPLWVEEHDEEHAAHPQTVAARLDQIGGQVNHLLAESDEQHRYTQTVHGHVDRLGEQLGRVEEGALRASEQLNGIATHADRLGTHLRNLQSASDQQDGRVAGLQERIDESVEQCARARAELEKAVSRHDLLEAGARRLAERQINDSSFLRAQLNFQQRLLGEWLPSPSQAKISGGAEAREREGDPEPVRRAPGDAAEPGSSGALASPSGPSAVVDQFAGQEMDALYLAFENTMCADRDTSKERVRFYLPYLKRAQAGGEASPILDLGCGRGEWLEVLREEGLQASGVDLNACMIDQCRERGLAATTGNALDYLASLADASCGAVTAFHLIEHLPLRVLVKFFRECLRVLRPGGLAIFETPNPNNVLVGACTFYSDYTHQRPLPPDSTRFLVEHMGFAEAEIVALHPRDRLDMVAGDGTNEALILRFNELFYGPRDYAILARAPAVIGSRS